jgi:RNA polymerase sigma factor (sigma-70 family)
MRPLHNLLEYLHHLTDPGTADQITDGELLRRFLDEEDEAAFQTLLRRHGSMVLATCRRILGDQHEAEDCCQATFLVLARKARSILRHGSLGIWLHRVAYHVAINARARAAKQRARERKVAEMASIEPEANPAGESGPELTRLLDEELRRLPEKYRAPLVLCYLEGKTHEEAARELRWPTGSMSRRLARAQQLLQQRLLRRGLAFSGSGLAVALSAQSSSAALPAAFVDATTRAAMPVAAGKAVAASVPSAKVAALVEETVASLSLAKMKVAAVVFLALALATAGAAVTLHPPWNSGTDTKTAEEPPLTTEWGEPVGGVRLRCSCDRDVYSVDRDLIRVTFAVQNVSDSLQHVTLLREGEEFTDVRLIGPNDKEYVVTGSKVAVPEPKSWAGNLRSNWVERVGMTLDPSQIAGGLPPGKYRVRGRFRRLASPDHRQPSAETRLESNETSFTLAPATGPAPVGREERAGCRLSLVLLADKPTWKAGDPPLPFAVVLNRRADDLRGLRFLQANGLTLYYSLLIRDVDGHMRMLNQPARSAGATAAGLGYARLLFHQLDRVPLEKSIGERFEWDPSGELSGDSYFREQLMSTAPSLAPGKYTVSVIYQLAPPDLGRFLSHPDAVRLVSNPIDVEIRD